VATTPDYVHNSKVLADLKYLFERIRGYTEALKNIKPTTVDGKPLTEPVSNAFSSIIYD